MHDVAVIGLGGMGSSAAYHLATRGLNVVGIDRFSPPHTEGSTHGRTRLIRQAYFEHPDYVPLLHRAYELWKELSQTCGKPLFHQVGLLEAGPARGVLIPGVRHSADIHHLSIENLTHREATRRFPGLVVPDEMEIVYEPTAGYLDVEDCVQAALRLAEQSGAKLQLNEPVTSWNRDGAGFVVETSRGRYLADRLVIAGGPWAHSLLASLGFSLRVLRKSLHWFATNDNQYDVTAGFPAFLVETAGRYFYGFPSIDEFGLKVAEHSGGDVVDPSHVDRSERPDEGNDVRAFVRSWLPGVSDRQTNFSTCLYTMSQDEHFILGEHPEEPGVVIIAGLSGHGFKFASVMGEILADLATTGKTSLPIEFLSPTRFG